jgi:hypothetical protein
MKFWAIAEASTLTHEHTVAWIDCTAKGRRAERGIFFRGNWSAGHKAVSQALAESAKSAMRGNRSRRTLG